MPDSISAARAHAQPAVRNANIATVTATFAIGAMATLGHAGITTWIGPDGGAFDAPRHWSDGVPGATDLAIFDLPESYVVNVGAPGIAHRYLVRAGAVSFAIADSLAGLSDSAVSPSLLVADLVDATASVTIAEGPFLGGHVIIADAFAAAGSLHVGGAASLLLDSTLAVGTLGHGSVVVEGDLACSKLDAAVAGFATATIEVDGGTLEIATSAILGLGGHAALTLRDGGVVSGNEIVAAMMPLSSAALEVRGTGSELSTTERLRVAHSGDSSLLVADGGRVIVGTDLNMALTFGSFQFPFFPPSSAITTVDGIGSEIAVAGTLRVQHGGFGTLELARGGRVTVGEDLRINIGTQSTVRFVLDGASAATVGDNGAPWLSVGGVYALTPSSIPHTIAIEIDPDDPPVAGSVYVVIDAATIEPSQPIALPEISGLTGSVAIETVDDRERLVVTYLSIADLDGDGIVDGSDLGLLLANWGPCDGTPCIGDLNGDGVVDGADLGILLTSWG